jgi:hypothetical protein
VTNRFSAIILIAATLAAPAFAQEAGLVLELNAAADAEGTCRVTIVANNKSGVDLTKIAYEVAGFDAAGTVTQMIVLEMGALGRDRSKVMQYDIPGGTCASLGRLQVNRSDACDSADGPQDICLKGLNATSKVEKIGFGA